MKILSVTFFLFLVTVVDQMAMGLVSCMQK